MGFQCRDCSYRGSQFTGGTCPACGSFNVVSRKPLVESSTQVSKPYRLAILAALWLLFGVQVYRQFFQ